MFGCLTTDMPIGIETKRNELAVRLHLLLLFLSSTSSSSSWLWFPPPLLCCGVGQAGRAQQLPNYGLPTWLTSCQVCDYSIATGFSPNLSDRQTKEKLVSEKELTEYICPSVAWERLGFVLFWISFHSGAIAGIRKQNKKQLKEKQIAQQSIAAIFLWSWTDLHGEIILVKSCCCVSVQRQQSSVHPLFLERQRDGGHRSSGSDSLFFFFKVKIPFQFI